MKKSIVVYGALFYSAWAAHVPIAGCEVQGSDQVLTLTLFKKQVGELQHFLFQLRGQLLGLDLKNMPGEIDPAAVAQTLAAQLSHAYYLSTQAAKHRDWGELSEYIALVNVIGWLHFFDRKLATKRECMRVGLTYTNPFK